MNFKKLFLITCMLLGTLILSSGYAQVPSDCEKCDSSLSDLGLDACTVIIVGKDASVDGSVMTTHTCDCGVCDWTWRHVPAADHKPGSKRKIYHINQFETFPPEQGLKWDTYLKNDTGVEIPQVPHTYAYIHGMFGYMNDQQLAIAESTIGTQDKMENTTPSATFDITMLTLLAMERCKTAREAIKTMGQLVEKYGYGHSDTGEMLAVADPKEVWIFEVMPVGPLWTPKRGKPGAIWCAQRVPDNHVSVCPNESRIGEIDLKKPDYFMASPNVISYAVDNGYYDPKSGKSFNWKKAYCPSPYSASSSNGSRVRLWRFLDLAAPSKKFSPDTPNMELPFSVKPDKKLSVQDVMTLTRDKCEGTQFYTARGLQGGPFKNPNYLPRPFKLDGKTYNTSRIIGVNRAEYVTVTQCRDWLPDPIGGIVWLAFGAQDTSCFMPLYAGITKIPDSFKIGDHWVFDRKSARWAFDYTDFHTQVVYSLAIKEVRKAQEKWEGGAVVKTPTVDKFALELYKIDPAQAVEYLTDYCHTNADSVIQAWWNLGDQLLVQFNHLWMYNIKTRKQGRLQYPEWWLRELVKYNNLQPQPEKKKK